MLPSTAIRSEFRSGRPRAGPEEGGVGASVRARFPRGGDKDDMQRIRCSNGGKLG